MTSVKPKLGNAEGLFKYQEPKGLDALAPKNPSSRIRMGWIAGIAALICLGTAVLIFQKTSQIPEGSITASAMLSDSNTTPDETVAVVHSKHENGELVGTLVRMDSVDNPATSSATAANIQLTEDDRARLLEIISSK